MGTRAEWARDEEGFLAPETDGRWPAERFWRSPQGGICREFDGYPVIEKYLQAVHFEPFAVRGEERPVA